MDPITLIAAALAAGAVAGVQSNASSAVTDAYSSLKRLAKKRLAKRSDAELILAKHEKSPDTWREPLIAELHEAKAHEDQNLIAAAQALMRLLEHAGSHGSDYIASAAGERSVAVQRNDGIISTGDDAVNWINRQS